MSRLNLNPSLPNQTVTATHEPPAQVADVRSLPTRPVALHLRGDAASLSATAGTVANAITGSDVRTAKVAALQQAIGAGTYKVAAGDLADRLIGSLLEGR